MHAHTHARTHAHTHAHTQSHVHTHRYRYTHLHTHTSIWLRPHSKEATECAQISSVLCFVNTYLHTPVQGRCGKQLYVGGGSDWTLPWLKFSVIVGRLSTASHTQPGGDGSDGPGSHSLFRHQTRPEEPEPQQNLRHKWHFCPPKKWDDVQNFFCFISLFI